jgi:outer membrane protein OmpA-like peptidoglycan-associated protein
MYWSKTMNLRFILGSGAAIVALTACTADDYYQSNLLTAPAGQQITAGFGSATANNVAVQNAKLQLEMVKNLTRLFASQVPATINFAFNSSTLDASAQAALRQQAEWIKAHPAITFRVYGHTDKVGGNAFNQRLGLRRARAAVNYLIAQGVSRKKVEAVVSFGETRPLVLTEARNQQNRRTVTEVKGFYNPNSAGVLDGKYAVRIYRAYTGTTQTVTSESIADTID